ncbi:hypothetical protein A7U60_g341 [Sanghuangporus baumii]|uniref:Uncharacterized protein n=1 Tax=Sanghuangporus baumii TaxID=108892 RepID=A0A9Q5I653_SANBA|nr:hypothetical protein A7U60_g341 [Sanghuangporus baumii]
MFIRRETAGNPANIPSESVKKYEALFVFLQVFGGQIGMPLFIVTMLFAPSVKRHLTLVNFCASWIIYSIVYCLTVYHDGDRSRGINSRLCYAQAVMVHGVVPLSVVTYCALHIQVWMGVRYAISQTSWLQKHKRKVLIALFIAPYVVFVAFSVASLVVLLEHPELLDRSGSYYCTINYDPLVFAVPGFAAGVIAIMIILEIIIGVTLVRRWKAVRSSQRLTAASISMIIRIAIFSVYGFATLGACAAFLARSLSIWPYLVQASLPTAVFLMFGTRRDVWRAWCFFRKRSRPERNEGPLSIRVTLERATDSTAKAESESEAALSSSSSSSVSDERRLDDNLHAKERGTSRVSSSSSGDGVRRVQEEEKKSEKEAYGGDVIVIGRLEHDGVC